ncbi:MAG: signal peptidase I [Coriobacteriia bacterium]|nr:signal peptidase I [Coriobacteriia bacterium]MCL2870224.1 signal peptidase I [Coriobacteriia bacterium]
MNQNLGSVTPPQRPASPAVQPGQASTTAHIAQPGQTSLGKATPTAGTVPAARSASTANPVPATSSVGTTNAHKGPGTGVPNPNYSYSSARPSILGTGLQRDIMSLLIKIAVIAGIVVALFTFIFGVFQYSSPAMSPAVNSGDLILFSRFDREYAAQDLVVVSYLGEMQVRRVVAIGGDTVDLEDGRLIVNGSPQQEANIFTETNRYESEIDFPLAVPQGHVFVLGDHREGATDSRIYGTVPVDDSQGKVISLFRRRGL